jgi:hypothetical protein
MHLKVALNCFVKISLYHNFLFVVKLCILTRSKHTNALSNTQVHTVLAKLSLFKLKCSEACAHTHLQSMIHNSSQETIKYDGHEKTWVVVEM